MQNVRIHIMIMNFIIDSVFMSHLLHKLSNTYIGSYIHIKGVLTE